MPTSNSEEEKPKNSKVGQIKIDPIDTKPSPKVYNVKT